MPDLSRRSMAAGVGLLAGAVAFRAAAQTAPSQLAVAAVPRFRAVPLTFRARRPRDPDRIGIRDSDSIGG